MDSSRVFFLLNDWSKRVRANRATNWRWCHLLAHTFALVTLRVSEWVRFWLLQKTSCVYLRPYVLKSIFGLRSTCCDEAQKHTGKKQQQQQQHATVCTVPCILCHVRTHIKSIETERVENHSQCIPMVPSLHITKVHSILGYNATPKWYNWSLNPARETRKRKQTRNLKNRNWSITWVRLWHFKIAEGYISCGNSIVRCYGFIFSRFLFCFLLKFRMDPNEWAHDWYTFVVF